MKTTTNLKNNSLYNNTEENQKTLTGWTLRELKNKSKIWNPGKRSLEDIKTTAVVYIVIYVTDLHRPNTGKADDNGSKVLTVVIMRYNAV